MAKIIRSLIVLIIVIAAAYFGFQRFQHSKQTAQLELQKITIVNQLESIGALETVTMRLEKEVEGQQGLSDLLPGYKFDNAIQKFLFQDSIKMIAYANIVAGFDLTKITTGSIQFVPNSSGVILTLPAATILQASLAPETKPFIRTTGILTKGNEQLETQLRNGALEKMKEEALAKGILVEAARRAKDALTPLLKGLGMDIVEVITQK
jgi:type II secretory pathway pseudopilin PulG